MNRRQSRLGSGLDALLPTADRSGGIREIPVSRVRPNPHQPRTRFDDEALDELAASIREHGIIQPLIVSEVGPDQYELIAGERRWRAAQRAGLDQVPAIVRETTPQQLLELALIENVQRADLNPLEEARAYQSLKDEFGLSDDQIARRIGKNSRETVANTRRLLKLSPAAQDAILNNVISAGHGRALLKCAAPEEQQTALEAMIAGELSVREAERLGDLSRELGGDIHRALAMLRQQRPSRTSPERRSNDRRGTRAEPPAADDQEIRRELERILGTPVNVARGATDLRITIVFHTDEKLQEFFDALNSASLDR